MSAQASTCTVNIVPPAFANAVANRAGSSTIMWTSIGSFVSGRSDSNTGRPIEIFGTNRPSITSKCNSSQPAASAALTSSPSLEKSAPSTDADIFRVFTRA